VWWRGDRGWRGGGDYARRRAAAEVPGVERGGTVAVEETSVDGVQRGGIESSGEETAGRGL
jgi:hypothetical protein